MRIPSSVVVIAIALATVAMILPVSSLARDSSFNRKVFRSKQQQEVVSGNYYCSGNVFSDGQSASISASFYLGATSDLTSGYSAPSRRTQNVPADLGTMIGICRTQVDAARSQMPPICAIGETVEESGEFGNGASVSSSFQFTCQGTRNEVIGVVGEMARLLVAP